MFFWPRRRSTPSGNPMLILMMLECFLSAACGAAGSCGGTSLAKRYVYNDESLHAERAAEMHRTQ